MNGFTVLPFVMVIAAAIVLGAFWMIWSTHRKNMARLLSLPTFDEYRTHHPELVTDGKVLCSKCRSNQVFVHLGAGLNVHLCRACGTCLYRSSL